MNRDDPLGGFGTRYGDEEVDPDRPPDAKPIRVYKVQYQPKLTGRLNLRALPPAEEMAGMELAARELPATLDEYRRHFEARSGGVTAAYVIVGLFGVLLPAHSGANWTAWSIAAWVIAAGVLVSVGHYPVEFIRDWFYTEPALLPRTRREHPKRYPMPSVPSVFGLLVVGGGMVGLSTIAPMLAAIVFGALGIVTLLYVRYGRLRLWTDLLPLYAGYGLGGSGAPGVWRVRLSPKDRKTYFRLIYLVFCLLGAVVSFRVPWETFIKTERITSWTQE